jgi:nicotinate-nucleotide adenylyltransferase
MSAGTRLGILGGTFDPIHAGHLAVVRAARRALGLGQILIIPSHYPPHRPADPRASAYHRFAMVAVALADLEGCSVSDVELLRDEPSYTSTTLGRVQAAGWAPSQIFFITGADAFAEIATWHEYPAVLDLAHFVIVSRPGWPVGHLRTHLPALRERMLDVSGGAPALDLATPRVLLLDAPTPDVSSTEIRERVRGGESLSGLVPSAVERYIMRQGLYGAPDRS